MWSWKRGTGSQGGSWEELCRGQLRADNREGGTVGKQNRRGLQVPQGAKGFAHHQQSLLKGMVAAGTVSSMMGRVRGPPQVMPRAWGVATSALPADATLEWLWKSTAHHSHAMELRTQWAPDAWTRCHEQPPIAIDTVGLQFDLLWSLPGHLGGGMNTKGQLVQDHNGLMVEVDTQMVNPLVQQAGRRGRGVDGLQGARGDRQSDAQEPRPSPANALPPCTPHSQGSVPDLACR